MRYVKPDYYDSFRCVADKCPDTCCAGWQIVIDDETLEKYKGDDSYFSDRLEEGVDWLEGTFVQKQRRCSMLNEKNLCDLIIQKGEGWLCETCRRYPRHVEEFEGLREWSLSLSCPVAAELMLNHLEKVSFLVEEDEKEDPLEEEFDDFDLLLFTQLEDARTVIFSIVQNRSIPLQSRLVLLMKMAEAMQLCVDESRFFDMEEVIRQFEEIAADKISAGKQESEREAISDRETLKKRYERIKSGFCALKDLERLREEWTEVLDTAERVLYSDSYKAYEEIYEAFCEEYLTDGENQWDIFMEQILVFFLYTYFCGAVYDDCVYSKVGLAVFSACFIQEFVMCSWFLADKHIDKRECIKLAYRYAREVEHSDENLNALEEWLFEVM